MRRWCMPGLLLALAGPAAAWAGQRGQPPWVPPAFVSGRLPDTPTQVVGGGQVLLDALVGDDGQVRDLVVLRATPPFTDAAVTAVNTWRFRAATGTRVLVAYVARPPTLSGPTLGTTPVDVGRPSDAIPYPTTVVVPEYPPRGRGEAQVLAEIEVDAAGGVTGARVLQSAGGFDEAALDAARQWRFRPARVDGAAVSTLAYVVFSWRPPVVAPGPVVR